MQHAVCALFARRGTERANVNALGDILTGCDYSYESQQWKSHGNIYDSDFCDIIRSIV